MTASERQGSLVYHILTRTSDYSNRSPIKSTRKTYLREIILVNAFWSKIYKIWSRLNSILPVKRLGPAAGVSLSIRREAWKQSEKNLPANAAVIHKNWLMRKVVESMFWQVFLGQKDRNPTFENCESFSEAMVQINLLIQFWMKRNLISSNFPTARIENTGTFSFEGE